MQAVAVRTAARYGIAALAVSTAAALGLQLLVAPWTGPGMRHAVFFIAVLAAAATLLIVGSLRRGRDRSERRRRDLEREMAARQRSEAMFRRLAEANLVGVGVGDLQGRVSYVNDEMLRMMGRTRADFEAGRLDWRAALAPESAPAQARAEADLLAQGQGGGYEKVFLRPDGGRTPFLSAGALLEDPGLHISVAVDLTERKQAEEALRAADRRKDEFLATLAHELRNPLAPIRSGLELLAQPGLDAPTAARARAILERQVSHMVRLVDDLLDVSRISHGQVPLRRSRVALAGVLHGALETSRPALEAAGHALVLELPPQPLWVDGDEVRLAQVFANLLNNAARYTPRGGTVRLSLVAEGRQAVVRVQDDGEGIPGHMLGRVFDLFVQVEPSPQRQGGLGLGLALVRNLVQMHGGEVRADSAGPGHGSVFTVRLPLAPGAAAALPAPAAASAGPAAAGGLRILLADDHVDAADGMALLLRALGHQVTCVHDGLAAVEAARRLRPQAALLDIGMPGCDGYEACRRIRALPGGTAVRLVALTGWGQEGDRQRAREAGFDRHLVKPADLRSLNQALSG
ncbi:hybrid sensor histidine kinase/response regulator [Ramlibacter tataouinensis]|uniref:histidine kinase n=1 Tax=Ramlibacter tataouinensis (strain ATCC BAA-407 / DSM 14655 / LMG 21543 / TTB310) TaxID=365046 RepID=F5Y603_RAMTT|nr:ATP-binding protein [Ramlibacter tataouinensis]AEG91507.1 candidate histidine kinase, hybrid [Ramlibacter tataouinensis TTB310]